MHSRFFKKSRSIFGSRLLQMNANTIKSLCNSNKFHFSLKLQKFKINKMESNIFENSENLCLAENIIESELTEDKEALEILKNLKEMMSVTIINSIRGSVCMITQVIKIS